MGEIVGGGFRPKLRLISETSPAELEVNRIRAEIRGDLNEAFEEFASFFGEDETVKWLISRMDGMKLSED